MGYKLISLSRGLCAKVSPEDYDELMLRSWFAKPMSSSHEKYYAATSGGNRHDYMHRVIMDAKKGEEVDHINRDPLDNRRSNLRICSRSENCANSTSRPNKYGYKGVTRCNNRPRPRYKGLVQWRGKLHYTKWFKTPFEAHLARVDLAKKLHGEFYFDRCQKGKAA